MQKYKKGQIVKGVVTGIENYGIFVKVDEDYSGLIHISEISDKFVKDINDIAKVGDNIFVQIKEVDEKNMRLNLSIKNINYKKKTYIRKMKIIETPSGFTTLAKMLPMWIDQNLEDNKK